MICARFVKGWELYWLPKMQRNAPFVTEVGAGPAVTDMITTSVQSAKEQAGRTSTNLSRTINKYGCLKLTWRCARSARPQVSFCLCTPSSNHLRYDPYH
jgi:hypothetical protein